MHAIADPPFVTDAKTPDRALVIRLLLSVVSETSAALSKAASLLADAEQNKQNCEWEREVALRALLAVVRSES